MAPAKSKNPPSLTAALHHFLW